MVRLSWDQVNAWRLSRHHLFEQDRQADVPDIVSRICGLQGQVMSGAELALWARLPQVEPSTLERLLWEERALIKTWVMRGTLHILHGGDLPLYVAARQAHEIRRPPSYFTYHGVSPEEAAANLQAFGAVLSESGMAREELAEAVAGESDNPHLAEVLLSGWGALLKPSAFRGDICFGPDRGQNVTFVRPERWLGQWKTFAPEEALREVARRYLAAYGPATPEDFARWWGLQPGDAKRLFRTVGDDLEAVEVDGWQALALVSSLPQIQQTEPRPVVNLLPAFDPYTIAHLRHPAILPETHKARVSRPQGWISPVALVSGRMAGVWEYERQRVATLGLPKPAGRLFRGDRSADARRPGGG